MADPHRSPRLDAATKDRIRQRIREGLSLRETAQSLGRKRPQIAKAVKEMGGVQAIREGQVRA